MKFIIYGTGAIGGTLAARLALSGYEVAGIARGRHLDTIKSSGLLLRTPTTIETAHFPCHADPSEIDFGPDDIILLTMKTQDTLAALERLRAAGVRDQAIICAQNGVANERFALRLFPNIYGMTVMMPVTYMVPGEINAFGVPKHGILDIGRYPQGTDKNVDTTVDALNASDFAAFAHEKVMENKYGKLLLNLSNIIGAALGAEARSGPFAKLAKTEGEAVLKAAGIVYGDMGTKNPRRDEFMRDKPIDGIERVGSSSAQSLARQSGSIETDYLNGEITLLGRLHNVPVPVNAYFCHLAQKMVTEAIPPGTISPQEVEKALAAFI